MRGYRLLKASRLSTSEKQHVLTQTGNSTQFWKIRLALRTLFLMMKPRSKAPRRIESGGMMTKMHGMAADWNCYGRHGGAYWDEPDYYADWHGFEVQWSNEEAQGEEDIPMDENAQAPEEIQYNEAHASVAEAQKTLREAREAVRKTRAARGYFAPKSMNGKGVSHASGSPSSPPSSSKRGRFKGGKSKGGPYTGSSGPCLVCNKLAQIVFHLVGRVKRKSNYHGFKGKGKFKGKSKSYFVVQCPCSPVG